MRLVIDCSYLCYRSLHTLGDLSQGEKKVGIIFGFLRQILKLSDQFKTNKFVFCWDSRKSYRKLIYPDYKGQRRVDMTEEESENYEIALEQFDEIREKVLPYMGFNNIFHQTGYEADDLIAHIVYRIPDDTVIVSADKDLFQLLRKDRFTPVKMWNFNAINDEDRFSGDWFGLKPKDWIKVKAIAGCTSDNIAGLPGVGDLTAAKYVAGALKQERLDAIKNRLSKFESGYALNHRLVALPYGGIKPIRITTLYEDYIDEKKFRLCFGQYGFRSLLYDDQITKWKKSFFGG